MVGDARLHRRKDFLPQPIPDAAYVVLCRAGTASVRAEEERAILGRESLHGEDEEPGTLSLADVPFRGATDSGLDDAGAEEVVAILERDREISRERFESRSVLGRRAGRNRGGCRRARGQARWLWPARPDGTRLWRSVRAPEIDSHAVG